MKGLSLLSSLFSLLSHRSPSFPKAQLRQQAAYCSAASPSSQPPLLTSMRMPQMLSTKQQCEHFGPQKLSDSRITTGGERGRERGCVCVCEERERGREKMKDEWREREGGNGEGAKLEGVQKSTPTILAPRFYAKTPLLSSPAPVPPRCGACCAAWAPALRQQGRLSRCRCFVALFSRAGRLFRRFFSTW